MKDGKPVEKYAVTYTYGDLLTVITSARDLNLPDILRREQGNKGNMQTSC
ncbi:MAG: hypothetical protein M1113_04375 [Candidatus Thermoplasmatota archaeon]|nr:hypothetical protein [Candidatus Thermoplasmatota archaeon]